MNTLIAIAILTALILLGVRALMLSNERNENNLTELKKLEKQNTTWDV